MESRDVMARANSSPWEFADVDADAGTGEGEARLVQAARHDVAAFAPLYRAYQPRVYRYLRLRTASDEDAADLTQQVFIQALDALPKYQERGLPFAAWIFRIARNAVIDAQRRERHRTHATLDGLPEALLVSQADGPEAAVLRQERLDRLRELLARLDPEKRELLGLRFATGLSSREIAAVVGKREEAVKRQITRIIQSLREQYDV
jgi:RNA polymerase sigma-70 factor (ECF subfamily)